jgi:hypothetical protein
LFKTGVGIKPTASAFAANARNPIANNPGRAILKKCNMTNVLIFIETA